MKNLRLFDDPLPDLNGRSILVTGGTGSFGKAFVRTVVEQFTPARLVVFSRDEQKQYEMEQDFPNTRYPFLRFFIGDVRDPERLEMAMRNIEYVVHAAALKHVPTAEYNPFECIHTNVFGAENVVRAALRAGVRKVIALSTDKAANPINLYGASKLAADKIFIAANSLSAGLGTRFGVVRYGNVMGSRGSVIPLFRKLVAENAKTIPITDPEMTRFWITLTQGVNFVMTCLECMGGGEIFVPKIPTMRIADLAVVMAPDATLETVGIRPAEKLHEVMIPGDEARNTLEFDDRYVIQPAFGDWTRQSDYLKDGRPVPLDFSYTSDTNTEWMDADSFQQMMDMV